MSNPTVHPAVQRDLSLQRLRDLTLACAAGAAGLLGVFSIIAATTVPGHGDGAATATTATGPNQGGFSQQAEGSGSGDGGVLQPPALAPVRQPSAQLPVAVSGGSR